MRAYLQMFVRCYVINVETTLMANANVILDGKVKIAVYDTTNAKSPIAMGTGNVPMVNAFVYEDSRANSAKKVNFQLVTSYQSIFPQKYL